MGRLFAILRFSCRTGERLSRVTPHKLADNLFLCLLICLPDNPRSLSTLSFPLGPIIRSPLWAPSSCSYCGRLYFYSPMMSVTTLAFMSECMLSCGRWDGSFLFFCFDREASPYFFLFSSSNKKTLLKNLRVNLTFRLFSNIISLIIFFQSCFQH